MDMPVMFEIIDSLAFSDFVGVDSSNQVPDGDTIGRFGNLLFKHKLEEMSFARVVEILTERGLILQKVPSSILRLSRHLLSAVSIGFHTIPAAIGDDLHPTFYQNQKLMYSLLFKAASETILELCDDLKYLGAVPGITAVLHTLGQNLHYHPHLHCIIRRTASPAAIRLTKSFPSGFLNAS
jgi:hypothetical protein